MYRIGLIAALIPVSTMAEQPPANIRALLQALRDLGYVEGQNLIFEGRSAEGRYERFADIAAELVPLRTDVLITNHNEATRQAKSITSTEYHDPSSRYALRV